MLHQVFSFQTLPCMAKKIPLKKGFYSVFLQAHTIKHPHRRPQCRVCCVWASYADFISWLSPSTTVLHPQGVHCCSQNTPSLRAPGLAVSSFSYPSLNSSSFFQSSIFRKALPDRPIYSGSLHPLANTLSHNLAVYFTAALIICNCVHFYLFAVSPLDCKAQEVTISQPIIYLTLRKLLNFSASVFLPVKWINYEGLGILNDIGHLHH